MADARHLFTPSDGDPKLCGHLVVRPHGRWGGHTCGLPASNATVHPPGMKAATMAERHLSVVPSLDEPTGSLCGAARIPS